MHDGKIYRKFQSKVREIAGVSPKITRICGVGHVGKGVIFGEGVKINDDEMI